jgi:hypothetical protein
MSLQTFYDKEPHTLLWAGSRAVREKLRVNGIPPPHSAAANAGHGLLIFEVSRSHTMTHHGQ